MKDNGKGKLFMLPVVKEQDLSYDTFISLITHQVKECLGDGYEVSVIKVTKNNSLDLESLIILRGGEGVAPSIHLAPYYEAYQEGVSFSGIVDRIIRVYDNCSVPILCEGFTYSFEEMKPYITYRIVNYERNKKLLNITPHIKFLDLAITFHCLIRDDTEGIGTIRITNEHLQMWGKGLEDISPLAKQNTKHLFPATIRPMDEVIRGLIEDEIFLDDEDNDFKEDLLNTIFQTAWDQKSNNMYVLSNQKGINGASCILYEGVLSEFSAKINADLYILPSSIHEVILVPALPGFSKEELTSMVQSVNEQEVPREDQLSDHIYFYSRKNGIISM